MGWYALEEIERAAKETRELLLPFTWGTWLRLILIVALTGGGMGGFNVPSAPTGTDNSYDYPGTGSQTSPMTSQLGGVPEIPATGMSTTGAAVSNLLILALVLFIPLVLVLFLVSNVFEFIYYQSLLDKDVSIRDNFRKHLGKGVRYFGFRIGVALLVLLLAGLMVLGFGATPLVGVLFLLGFLVMIIPVAIFLGLTQDFVLLEMIESGEGLIESWRLLWPELREQWKQVAVYLVVKFGLGLGAGIAGFVWILLTFFILLIPFGILGFILYSITPVLAWLAAFPGLLALLFLILGFQVVIQTYLRYYTILVYHDLTA